MHHIKEITIQNFITHENSTIQLPERGIILITGKNGSGKSSFVEAVTNTFWGESLRKTAPWITGKKCSSKVVTYNGLSVIRSKDKNKPVVLKYNDTDYGTATKAQKDLDPLVGDYRSWCKTSVFSSRNVSVFARATDKERKELIEGLLGSHNFNEALSQCRKDLKRYKEGLWGVERELGVTEEKIKGKKRELEILQDSDRDIVDSETIEELADEVSELDSKEEAFKSTMLEEKEDLKDFKKQLETCIEDAKEAEINYNNTVIEVQRLKGKKCPTCKQDISAKLRQELTAKLDQAEKEKTRVVEQTSELKRDLKYDIQDTESIISNLNKKLFSINAKREHLINEITIIKRKNKEQRRLKKQIETAKKELEDCINKESGLQGQFDNTQKEIDLLTEVESVLGPEGFRAHILGKALKGIEALSNNWLAKISEPGVYIELKPYSELKKGGVRDRILLTVHGIGGGHGYDACSDGEQRRIDISFLFALSDFEAGAKSVEPGTLFIDEAFDGLDDDGRVAVADVLQELSETRCILIISHDEKLAQALRPIQHYRVENGKVS